MFWYVKESGLSNLKMVWFFCMGVIWLFWVWSWDMNWLNKKGCLVIGLMLVMWLFGNLKWKDLGCLKLKFFKDVEWIREGVKCYLILMMSVLYLLLRRWVIFKILYLRLLDVFRLWLWENIVFVFNLLKLLIRWFVIFDEFVWF